MGPCRKFRAAWPMRACGVEVIEVPTALLSNHPHYPSMRGRLLDPDLVDEILSGLAERGIHQRATAILSGFMGRAGTALGGGRVLCGKPKTANPGSALRLRSGDGRRRSGLFSPMRRCAKLSPKTSSRWPI